MKLTLTHISRFDKTSKTGKPFVSVSIKAQEYGEKYISGFGNKANQDWKVGDVVEVEKVEQKGQYLNFEMPKSEKAQANEEVLKGIKYLILKTEAIDRNLKAIVEHLSGGKRLDVTSAGTPVPTFDKPKENPEEINPEDIPF